MVVLLRSGSFVAPITGLMDVWVRSNNNFGLFLKEELVRSPSGHRLLRVIVV